MAEPNLAEDIANHMRRQILLGELAPGQSIKERDNAAELGVSRTPLREAIRMLAKEGLVILRPARSPIVADPSLKEVSDALEVLGALELFGCTLAVENATESQIARVIGHHEKLLSMADTRDSLDFFEEDMAFHKSIVEATGNLPLIETHGAYLARLWRARYLSAQRASDRVRVLRQHGVIAEGLSTRDIPKMTNETKEHFDYLFANVSVFYKEREDS